MPTADHLALRSLRSSAANDIVDEWSNGAYYMTRYDQDGNYVQLATATDDPAKIDERELLRFGAAAARRTAR